MKKVITLFCFALLSAGYLSAQCSPDTEAPVIHSISGLTFTIQNTSVTVAATDLLQSVQDNCSLAADIQISMRRCGFCTDFPLAPDGKPVSNIAFTCSDKGTQVVELWARDAAGNKSVDTLYLVIAGSNCGNSSAPSILSCARTETNVPVNDVNWDLGPSSPGLPPTSLFNTSIGPCMTNNGIPFLGNYTITPTRDNNPLNGVSTFDLVLINKHILGKEALTSPYKILAADANASRSLTTFDIVELRKLILGIYTELPNNNSWGFVPKSFVFPNPANPFQTVVPNSLAINAIQAGSSPDFVAYKVGDVNNNVVACNYFTVSDTRSATALLSDDALLRPGESARIALRVPRPTTLLGAQFALQFDPEALDITGVTLGDNLPANTNGGYFALPEPGLLTFSWDNLDAPVLEAHAPLVYLNVKALQSVQLSRALRFEPKRIQPELYSATAETQALLLQFAPLRALSEMTIFPVEPNPSAGPVFVPVSLEAPAPVRIEVFDLSGRQLYFSETDCAAGFQRLEIPAGRLPGQGSVLTYRVQVGNRIEAGKLIRQ